MRMRVGMNDGVLVSCRLVCVEVFRECVCLVNCACLPMTKSECAVLTALVLPAQGHMCAHMCASAGIPLTKLVESEVDKVRGVHPRVDVHA